MKNFVCLYPPKYTSEREYLLGVITFLVRELRKYEDIDVMENNEYQLCEWYKSELKNVEKKQ